MSTQEDRNKKIADANLQFLVLLNLVIERIEYLETEGFIYGSLKNFLKNGKKQFESFITKVFKVQDTIEEDTALSSSTKLLVMQERVEKALENEYIITSEERMLRAKAILKGYITPVYELGDSPEKLELKKELLIDEVLEKMYEKNLFNF